MLQARTTIPVLTCHSPHSRPSMLSHAQIMCSPVGLGEYACCEARHRTASGPCPCLKELMAPLLREMIEHRSAHHLRRDELLEYRMWRASTAHLCTGISTESTFDGEVYLNASRPHSLSRVSRGSINDRREFQEKSFGRRTSYDVDVKDGKDDASLKAFLLNYRFKGATDYGPHGDGVPPLVVAAIEGSPVVVRALLESHADPNYPYRGRKELAKVGLIRGVLPLHAAVASRASNQATVHALLAYGANPNAIVSDLKVTPLVASLYYGSAEGMCALHEACTELGMVLDLEKGMDALGWTPLMLAAHNRSTETIGALIEIGCNRNAVSDNGYSVFRAACDNRHMDLATLELLYNNGDGVDINEPLQPRTAVWRAVSTMSEMAVTCVGAVPVVGGLARAFADLRGSTPLHAAAKAGRLDIVEWLVHRGAMRSLQAKTASGASPAVLAERGGHYAVVSFLKGMVARPRLEC